MDWTFLGRMMAFYSQQNYRIFKEPQPILSKFFIKIKDLSQTLFCETNITKLPNQIQQKTKLHTNIPFEYKIKNPQ